MRLLVGLEIVAGDWLVWLAWNGSLRELRGGEHPRGEGGGTVPH